MDIITPRGRSRAFVVALILMLLLINPGSAHPPQDSNDSHRVPALPAYEPARSAAMLISPADSIAVDAVHPVLPDDASILHQHAPQSGVGAGKPVPAVRALAGVTYVVTSTLDSGPGSLRQRILDANASPGADSIHFAIPGSGVQTITPLSALPVITDSLTIDGSTQPGASCAAWPPTIRIVLDGSQAADPLTTGLTGDAPQIVLRGLNIQGFLRNGIYLQGGSGHQLQCLLVGTSVDGTSSRGNGRDGIQIADATDTQIGGPEAGQGNLIAGNTRVGILISASGAVTRTQPARNRIEGNLIGTDHTGMIAFGNGIGVASQDAIDTHIGGTAAGAGNLISGNGTYGIYVNSSGFAGTLPSAGVRIEGNRIGTNANGTAALGNTTNGVQVQDSPGTMIGGTTAGAGNTISGNGSMGVFVLSSGNSDRPTTTGVRIEGNRIGTNASGTTALGNTAEGVKLQDAPETIIGGTTAGAGNTISGNGAHGILVLSSGLPSRPPSTNTRIEGNRIGTNASGTAALGNTTNGVQVEDTPGTVIGGTAAEAGNTISGNGAQGILILSTGLSERQPATNIRIEGNRIGTDGTGSTGIGNTVAGVWIQASLGNVIGGTTAGAGNTISANGKHGVVVFSSDGTILEGNRIGTDQTGTLALGNIESGIYVQDSASTQVGGAAASAGNTLSGNGEAGVLVYSTGFAGTNQTSGTILEGNRIGTNQAGTLALGNAKYGVYIQDSASTRIGGTAAGAGNTISANGERGIVVTSSGNENTVQSSGTIIEGNRVGTDQTGMLPLGNLNSGIHIQDSASTRIGGTAVGAGNTISANGDKGVMVHSSGNPNTTPTSGTIVQGNRIGTDATGSVALGNTTAGVHISNAQGNLIGGTAVGAGNTIRGNVMQGVLIQSLGANNTLPATENRIVGNRISHNGGLGIDLNGDGVTRNDLLDADSGPNRLQNTPVLTEVVIEPSTISVTGRLHSTPSMTFTLDFYGNSVENASDGEVPLGQQTVTTDTSGNATFSVQLPHPATTPPLLDVTATATDPQGNTSELFTSIPSIPQREYLPLIRR